MNAKLDDELRRDFVVEAGELVRQLGAQLIGLESSPDDGDILNAVFRTFHTVKGGASFLALEPMVVLCHHAEDLLNAARNHCVALATPDVDALLDVVDLLEVMLDALAVGRPLEAPPAPLLRRLLPAVEVVSGPVAPIAPSDAAGVVVDDDEFEALLDSLYGDQAPGFAAPADVHPAGAAADDGRVAVLAEAPASAAPHAAHTTMVHVDTARLDVLVDCAGELMAVRKHLRALSPRDGTGALAQVAAELDRVAGDMQAAVLALRMQPVSRLFQRFPRVVRDLARRLGKEVDLVLAGEAIDLDRGVAEALADPLVHLLRNAVDHGIDFPYERERAGKPRRGRINLGAAQRGGSVVITVHDDGRGMDPETLRRNALDKGLLDAAAVARLTVAECYDLIFRPGFSTAVTVSETSGRGVGMDVVKTRMVELGGSVKVSSTPGQGTTVEMEVPLAMSVLRVLVVRAGTHVFALPVANVEGTFALAAGQEQVEDGRLVVRQPGRVLELANLSAWASPAGVAGRQVVVVRSGLLRVGCLVDAVFQREDVIVRSLGPMFAGLPGIAGAAVIGDGELALVVDLSGLVDPEGGLLPILQMKA